ncbi:TonB-dependent receptor domain-containing protein [Vibrio sp. LaRot3]|uniref:TonB-dependent receptor domain-containing protein n=1 Tax=Vibrio sp. LaRot3 TaxID=2998829 RepID=UPI0022CDCBCB|nr:TonB-dependent receptor [Vibrio sp. LaRot3]MDA0147096.1 TonB-dependent receptor [Vibrio sp. LaRot3]
MFKSKPSVVAAALALSIPSVYANTSSSDVSEVMVVTATKTEQSLQDAPASVTVVTSEELNRLPATDITTALQNVAGVRISKATGSEPKIVIRGLKNQNSANDNFALVLVNGRRVTSSETLIRGATFDLSSVPMSAIERVEVIRGPMSALYGSEAIGGVVNIILKQPTNETEGAFSVTYSTPDDNSADASNPGDDGEFTNFRGYLSGALVDDKLLYTASVDLSDRNRWNPDNAGPTFQSQSEQQRSSFNTSLIWLASESTTVTWDAGYSDDEREEGATGWENFYDTQKFTSGLELSNDWSWGSSDIRYFYERTHIDEQAAHPAVGSGEIEQVNHTVDGKVAGSIGDIHYVTAGFDVSHTDLENERSYSQQPSVQQSAFFLQDEISFTDDLALTLSGRFTHHDQFGSDLSPRAYLVFNATENLTFKGGYGEGFKAPTMFQSDENFSLISCGGGCYLIGNKDLVPQTSKTYEFTTLYSQPTWYVQGTIFFNQINDLIDRDTTTQVGTAPDGKPQIQYVNYSRVETQGIELETQFDVTDSIYVSAAATYIDSEDKTTGLEMLNSPDWLANANINWAPNYDWSLFAGVNYTGSQFNEQRGVPRYELDGYSTVNLGASYAVTDVFTVKAGITNLFDERLDESELQYEEQEFGRTYYLTMDLQF